MSDSNFKYKVCYHSYTDWFMFLFSFMHGSVGTKHVAEIKANVGLFGTWKTIWKFEDSSKEFLDKKVNIVLNSLNCDYSDSELVLDSMNSHFDKILVDDWKCSFMPYRSELYKPEIENGSDESELVICYDCSMNNHTFTLGTYHKDDNFYDLNGNIIRNVNYWFKVPEVKH